jgi:hypothetical protein
MLADVIEAKPGGCLIPHPRHLSVPGAEEVLATAGREVLEAAILTAAVIADKVRSQSLSVKDRSGVRPFHRRLQDLEIDPHIWAAALPFAAALAISLGERAVQAGEIARLCLSEAGVESVDAESLQDEAESADAARDDRDPLARNRHQELDIEPQLLGAVTNRIEQLRLHIGAGDRVVEQAVDDELRLHHRLATWNDLSDQRAPVDLGPAVCRARLLKQAVIVGNPALEVAVEIGDRGGEVVLAALTLLEVKGTEGERSGAAGSKPSAVIGSLGA